MLNQAKKKTGKNVFMIGKINLYNSFIAHVALA